METDGLTNTNRDSIYDATSSKRPHICNSMVQVEYECGFQFQSMTNTEATIRTIGSFTNIQENSAVKKGQPRVNLEENQNHGFNYGKLVEGISKDKEQLYGKLAKSLDHNNSELGAFSKNQSIVKAVDRPDKGLWPDTADPNLENSTYINNSGTVTSSLTKNDPSVLFCSDVFTKENNNNIQLNQQLLEVIEQTKVQNKNLIAKLAEYEKREKLFIEEREKDKKFYRQRELQRDKERKIEKQKSLERNQEKFAEKQKEHERLKEREDQSKKFEKLKKNLAVAERSRQQTIEEHDTSNIRSAKEEKTHRKKKSNIRILENQLGTTFDSNDYSMLKQITVTEDNARLTKQNKDNSGTASNNDTLKLDSNSVSEINDSDKKNFQIRDRKKSPLLNKSLFTNEDSSFNFGETKRTSEVKSNTQILQKQFQQEIIQSRIQNQQQCKNTIQGNNKKKSGQMPVDKNTDILRNLEDFVSSSNKLEFFSLYAIDELVDNFKFAKDERERHLQILYQLDQYLNHIRIVIKQKLNEKKEKSQAQQQTSNKNQQLSAVVFQNRRGNSLDQSPNSTKIKLIQLKRRPTITGKDNENDLSSISVVKSSEQVDKLNHDTSLQNTNSNANNTTQNTILKQLDQKKYLNQNEQSMTSPNNPNKKNFFLKKGKNDNASNRNDNTKKIKNGTSTNIENGTNTYIENGTTPNIFRRGGQKHKTVYIPAKGDESANNSFHKKNNKNEFFVNDNKLNQSINNLNNSMNQPASVSLLVFN